MLKKFTYFFTQVFKQFYYDGCIGRAAGLAYTTLLSLVPLFTVSFSILSAFPVFHGVAAQIQNWIFANFVAESAQAVQQHLLSFMDQVSKLPILGMLFLLVAAVLLIFSMEQAFNNIWRVKKRRAGTSAFILYWGVLTFLPIVVSVILALTSYFFSLPFLFNGVILSGFKQFVFWILPYFTIYTAFSLLYLSLPNCSVPVKSALLAAIPTTIFFELAKFGFAFYITSFPTYKLIYGALAAIPIFLIWLYISWFIILFGAVISHVLTQVYFRVIPKAE
jgi:membrane protein